MKVEKEKVLGWINILLHCVSEGHAHSCCNHMVAKISHCQCQVPLEMIAQDCPQWHLHNASCKLPKQKLVTSQLYIYITDFTTLQLKHILITDMLLPKTSQQPLVLRELKDSRGEENPNKNRIQSFRQEPESK